MFSSHIMVRVDNTSACWGRREEGVTDGIRGRGTRTRRKEVYECELCVGDVGLSACVLESHLESKMEECKSSVFVSVGRPKHVGNERRKTRFQYTTHQSNNAPRVV
jgi:hypothetical protein